MYFPNLFWEVWHISTLELINRKICRKNHLCRLSLPCITSLHIKNSSCKDKKMHNVTVQFVLFCFAGDAYTKSALYLWSLCYKLQCYCTCQNANILIRWKTTSQSSCQKQIVKPVVFQRKKLRERQRKKPWSSGHASISLSQKKRAV